MALVFKNIPGSPPMVIPEDIISSMSLIEGAEPCYELPEISSEALPMGHTAPETLEQLNALLSRYSLPTFAPDDTVATKLEKLQEIGQARGLWVSGFDYPAHREKMQTIGSFKELESLCDTKEVELANMQVANLQKYSNKSLEELRSMLDGLKDALNAERALDTCRGLLDDIRQRRESVVEFLAFMRPETEGAYVTECTKDRLRGQEEDWCRVLYKIIDENGCRVESAGAELAIDRVDLLKIIYSFCSKGILEYDRLNDRVCIAKQKGTD